MSFEQSQIHVRRTWTGGAVGVPKSKASKAPVPLHLLLAEFLREWKDQTPYSQPDDWGLPFFPLQRKAAAHREHAG